MNPIQLDQFQGWLKKQADESRKRNSVYFCGRAGALSDAFEYLAILRMQSPGTTSGSALPAWIDRITFRPVGCEVILRVPGWDEFGDRMATNHHIDLKAAIELQAELAWSILRAESPNAVRSATEAES